MAGPFDFLFGGGDSAPAPAASRSATPEPFGIMDVLGIGSDARKQQRAFAHEEQKHQRGVAQSQKVNQAENAIQQRVIELRGQMPENAQPQQVFGALLRDPIFAQNAALVPVERQQALVKSLMDGLAPPKPEMIDVGPGHSKQAVDPITKKPIPGTGFSQPTAEVQRYQHLQGLSPDDLAKVQRAQEILAKSAAPSDKEQAWAWLQRNGIVTDPAEQHLWMSGVKSLQKRATRSPDGTLLEEKHFIVDKSDPNNVVETEIKARPSAPDPNAPAQPRKPGPGQPQGGAELPPKPARIQDGTMFDMAGGLNRAYDTATRWAGQIPAFRSIGEDGQQKTDALNIYRNALTAGLKEGRELKAELEARKELLPGNDENPLSEVNKALSMHDYLTRARARAATVTPGATSADAYRRAQRKILEIDEVLDTLPDRDVMQQRADFYRQNTEWSVKPPTVDEVTERARKQPAPNGDKPRASGPDYSSMDDKTFVQTIEKRRGTMSAEERKAAAAEAKRRGLLK